MCSLLSGDQSGFKGIGHSKMKFLPLFTHPHITFQILIVLSYYGEHGDFFFIDISDIDWIFLNINVNVHKFQVVYIQQRWSEYTTPYLSESADTAGHILLLKLYRLIFTEGKAQKHLLLKVFKNQT